MEQGWNAFQSGAFSTAISFWQQAAHVYAKSGEVSAQGIALTQLAQAYQALGRDQKALTSLKQALKLTKRAHDPSQEASILGHLGNVYLAMGQLEDASQWLQQSRQIAETLEDASLLAQIFHHMGSLSSARDQRVEAMQHYGKSLQLATQIGNRALGTRAAINAGRTAILLQQYPLAKDHLNMAWLQVKNLPSSQDTAYSLISIGQASKTLGEHLPEFRDALLQRSVEALIAAAKMAEGQNDDLAASYAWGYLGQLYELEQRYEDALQLSRRATFAAQRIRAPESLYRWQWQIGRLLRATGDIQGAIAAHQRAVDTLQSFRPEFGPVYGRPRASFRKVAEPVYTELIDLLLQQAATISDRAEQEARLLEAQKAVELFKTAELEDYFHDDCVVRVSDADLDKVSQTAVVIYPIILPDRLELLVRLPGELKRFTVSVGGKELTDTVRHFRRFLEKRTTREYLPYAHQLYAWLIKPLEAELKSVDIDTLVFVPDGPLRTIPMSALHDGKGFLIQTYA